MNNQVVRIIVDGSGHVEVIVNRHDNGTHREEGNERNESAHNINRSSGARINGEGSSEGFSDFVFTSVARNGAEGLSETYQNEGTGSGVASFDARGVRVHRNYVDSDLTTTQVLSGGLRNEDTGLGVENNVYNIDGVSRDILDNSGPRSNTARRTWVFQGEQSSVGVESYGDGIYSYLREGGSWSRQSTLNLSDLENVDSRSVGTQVLQHGGGNGCVNYYSERLQDGLQLMNRSTRNEMGNRGTENGGITDNIYIRNRPVSGNESGTANATATGMDSNVTDENSRDNGFHYRDQSWVHDGGTNDTRFDSACGGTIVEAININNHQAAKVPIETVNQHDLNLRCNVRESNENVAKTCSGDACHSRDEEGGVNGQVIGMMHYVKNNSRDENTAYGPTGLQQTLVTENKVDEIEEAQTKRLVLYSVSPEVNLEDGESVKSFCERGGKIQDEVTVELRNWRIMISHFDFERQLGDDDDVSQNIFWRTYGETITKITLTGCYSIGDFTIFSPNFLLALPKLHTLTITDYLISKSGWHAIKLTHLNRNSIQTQLRSLSMDINWSDEQFIHIFERLSCYLPQLEQLSIKMFPRTNTNTCVFSLLAFWDRVRSLKHLDLTQVGTFDIKTVLNFSILKRDDTLDVLWHRHNIFVPLSTIYGFEYIKDRVTRLNLKGKIFTNLCFLNKFPHLKHLIWNGSEENDHAYEYYLTWYYCANISEFPALTSMLISRNIELDRCACSDHEN